MPGNVELCKVDELQKAYSIDCAAAVSENAVLLVREAFR